MSMQGNWTPALGSASSYWKNSASSLGETHPDTLDTMHQLAWTYGLMHRLPESEALFENLIALRRTVSGPAHDSTWEMERFAQVCLWAGKLDRAERLLRELLEQQRNEKDSPNYRNKKANILGFLAVNLLLQERYDEAESFAREAIAMNQIGDLKRHYWVSALGAVLLCQRKFAEAEPLLLKGYDDMKLCAPIHPAMRIRLTEVGGWLVRLYQETNQPKKAQAWRKKLKASEPGAASAGVK